MNSLEYIENEIKEVKHEIKINTIRIENMINKIFYKERAEVLNNKLQTLEQIKTELEAWKVIKNKGVDMLIFMLYIDNLQEYNDYISSLAGECNYEKLILTQQEANKIKKALG